MVVLVGVVVGGVRSPLDRAHSMHRDPVRSHFRHDEGQCAVSAGLAVVADANAITGEG